MKRYYKYPPKQSPRRERRRAVLSVLTTIAWWAVGTVALYFILSLIWDTPREYAAKQHNKELREQYEFLTARLDTLDVVLGNVVERDQNVFRMLFESEPYSNGEELQEVQWDAYNTMNTATPNALYATMRRNTIEYENSQKQYENKLTALQERMNAMGDSLNYIPAIQPIVNRELTLLTASYGMRIHPFYKSLSSHQGVDYTVPEGTRVFATADGTVKEVQQRKTSSGMTVVINHGNGYETSYNHLSKINVSRGQKVRRGDIIALTGNSGLSLAPHLHYEVRYNGMRVNPVHYFFMELGVDEYQRILEIARSGMQSFD